LQRIKVQDFSGSGLGLSTAVTAICSSGRHAAFPRDALWLGSRKAQNVSGGWRQRGGLASAELSGLD